MIPVRWRPFWRLSLTTKNLPHFSQSKELLNTRTYDDETQIARFVISDGNVAVCPKSNSPKYCLARSGRAKCRRSLGVSRNISKYP